MNVLVGGEGNVNDVNIVVVDLSGNPGLLGAFDADVEAFAFVGTVACADPPLLVHLKHALPHLAEQDLATGIRAEDRRWELHPDLEDALGGRVGSAGREHQRNVGVSVRTPESFDAASVEIGNRLGELQAILAFDLADLELGFIRTPFLAAYLSAERWHRDGAKTVDDVDLEGARVGVPGFVEGDVRKLVRSVEEGLSCESITHKLTWNEIHDSKGGGWHAAICETKQPVPG